MLETMKSLTDLDLRNNPVGKGNSKYRDHIIMTSQSLRELDGKEIKDQQLDVQKL